MERNLPNRTSHYEVFDEGRPIMVPHGGYLEHRRMV